MRALLALVLVATLSSSAAAVITATTQHDASGNGLDGQIAVGDAISGLVATELPGDHGWHPAPTPPEPERLQAFTDDRGAITGLTGLLNDFPGVGLPTKRLQYDLASPTDIEKIQILTGNFGGDGRVFSTAVIKYSTDNGSSFAPLGGFVPTIGPNSSGYYQSDASGTVNAGVWRSTLLEIFNDSHNTLAAGVTNLTIDLYAVDNTGGENRDPFDGINPFTGIDDTKTAAFVSPLVWEIDVVAVPEPATAGLLIGGLFAMLAAKRRR
jgi:hypothetical protein